MIDSSYMVTALSLGKMLTKQPTQIHMLLWHATGKIHRKAVEHQHPCLSEVTVPPNGHFLAVRSTKWTLPGCQRGLNFAGR